jgi:hypothetical protein
MYRILLSLLLIFLLLLNFVLLLLLNIRSFVHQCTIHFLFFIIRRHVSASHGHLQVL